MTDGIYSLASISCETCFNCYVKFEVFTTMEIQVIIFWVVVPCNVVLG